MGLFELFCALTGIWLVVADPVEKDLRFDGKGYKNTICMVEQFVKPVAGQYAQYGAHAIITCSNKDTGQLLEPKYQPPKVYLRDVRAVYQVDPRCKGPAPVAKVWDNLQPTPSWTTPMNPAHQGMPADEAAALQRQQQEDEFAAMDDDEFDDTWTYEEEN